MARPTMNRLKSKCSRCPKVHLMVTSLNFHFFRTEKISSQLIQAYCKKGIALAESLEKPDGTVSSSEEEKIRTELENIWLNLNKLTKGDAIEHNIKQTGKFLEKFYRVRGDKASLLKVLLKIQSESDSPYDTELQIIELCRSKSEWVHLQKFLERGLSAKFCNLGYCIP